MRDKTRPEAKHAGVRLRSFLLPLLKMYDFNQNRRKSDEISDKERIFPIIFPSQHLNVQKLLGYFYFSKRYPGNYKEKAIFALFSQPARVVL